MKNDKEKRLIRLLKIILTLDQGTIRLENVAKEENCSLRTIQRDISALERAGLPLIRNYNSTWAFMEDFNLRKITATNAIDNSFLTEILNYINTNKLGQKSEFADKNKSISALYAALANKLYKENDYQAALNLYKRAFSFNKQDADIKLFIIKNYIKLKEYKKALKMMQEPSETAEISREKVLCYLQLGQDKKALDEMDTYFRLTIPADPLIPKEYQKMDILYRLGRYNEISELIKKRLLNAVNKRNIYYMYYANLRMHNLEEIKKYFTAYNTILLDEINSQNTYYNSLINRESAESIRDAIQICNLLCRKEETVKYCKLLYKNLTCSVCSDISTWMIRIYNISHLYRHPNSKTELYNWCNQALKQYPTYGNYFAMALYYYMHQNITKAKENFNKCLEYLAKEYKKTDDDTYITLKDQDFELYCNYLKPLIDDTVIKDFTDKINNYKLKNAKSILKNSGIKDKSKHLFAGKTFKQFNKNKEAIICLQRALCDNSYYDRRILEDLCVIYKQQKDESNYRKCYSLALETFNQMIYGDNFRSFFYLWKKAEFLYDNGNYETAFLYFKKSLKQSYFTWYDRQVINMSKNKFIDCCRKFKDTATEKEFLYLYQTAGKYPIIRLALP